MVIFRMELCHDRGIVSNSQIGSVIEAQLALTVRIQRAVLIRIPYDVLLPAGLAMNQKGIRSW